MAVGLAAELKKLTGVTASLNVSATGGAFEVTVDKELVFSKAKENRFPKRGEVAELIKKKFTVTKAEK